MNSVLDGVIIGGAGGAAAGIAVWLFQYLHAKCVEKIHKDKIFFWMKNNTKNEAGKQFRSTRAIASWNNLTEERVRYICSIDKRIHLTTGEKEDMWSIHDRVPRSVYEERGLQHV